MNCPKCGVLIMPYCPSCGNDIESDLMTKLAAAEKERDELKAERNESLDIMREALGTDPKYQSFNCVQLFTDWINSLKAERDALKVEVEQRTQAFNHLLATDNQMEEKISRLEAAARDVGVCGLAMSHGCTCPYIEPLRAALEGEKEEEER